jgi:hypothetical protein
MNGTRIVDDMAFKTELAAFSALKVGVTTVKYLCTPSLQSCLLPQQQNFVTTTTTISIRTEILD